MKKFFERYKHAIPLIVYAIIYLSWFIRLERTVNKSRTIIHMSLDDMIPFVEIFIIPYLLWFAYCSLIVAYLFFKDKPGYCRACVFLFTGMTVFLVISTLWPNGHHLRPSVMPRDNIFTAMIAKLYITDTPTNLWPSIHVYNSLGVHFAITHNRQIGRKLPVRIGSFLLCTSIILSTVFIKQHSLFDVLTAFVMAGIMYVVVYSYDIVTVYRHHRVGIRGRIRQV